MRTRPPKPDSTPPENRKRKKTSSSAVSKSKQNTDPTTRLVRLVSDVRGELFHTASREAFATICITDHWETLRIKSSDFRHWIAGLYYYVEGKAASQENIAAALNILEGQALYASEEKTVHIRVAGHDGQIYLDLADRKRQAIQITTRGWGLVPKYPVKFLRTSGMLELPTPVRGGSLAELRPFLNLKSEGHFLLILGWLVGALRPTGPYPILAVEGIHGSAKSTSKRIFRSFVDPNVAALRSTPKNERDLMISAANGWVQCFENISEVPPWLSDCLCRLSTGGGFSTRRNYSDDEEKLFDAMRPVLLNGISVGLERADVLDRSLVILLSEISDESRLTEAESGRRREARVRVS